MWALITLLYASTVLGIETNIGGKEVTITLHRTNTGEELPVTASALEPELAKALSMRSTRVSQDTSTTSNWCGVAVYNPNDDPTTQFTQVTGTWTIPTVSLRSGQTNNDQPSIAQWIGIDGGGPCSTGLLQGGTVSQVFFLHLGSKSLKLI